MRSHRTLEAVGRLGGDEFVALLPEVADERDAERVAERILEAMREPIIIGDAGVLRHRQRRHRDLPARRRQRRRPDAQLRRRDVLGQVGRAATPSSLYRPSLAGQGREKLELESALHKAIERNELVLHYQPKIDVRGARMVGAEALMRWRRHGVAGAAGRLHPAGRGDRPDHRRSPNGRSARRRARRGSGRTTSASPTRSPSTCRAGCSSAPTWSSTSTRRSPPTACRTTRSSSRSPRRA